MKTNLYSKGILTVIVVAFLVIAFKDFPPEASASDCATSWQLEEAKQEILKETNYWAVLR